MDFEILPDPQDPRSPNDIIKQVEDALKNPNSLLRSGPSGFLLDGATFDRSPLTSPEILTAPGVSQPATQVFPPTKIDSRIPSQNASPGAQPIPDSLMAPGADGPPDATGEMFARMTELLKPAADSSRDTTGELFMRITELLKTIDDMKAEKEKADLEKADLLKKLSESDSLLLDKMKEADLLQSTVSELRKDLSYTAGQLDDTKKQLHQAKEMWMKESARATTLRDQLDKKEVEIADKEKEVCKMVNDHKRTETENVNLKNLINRSNEIVSSTVLVPQTTEPKFSQGDSYFVRGSTMANLATMNSVSIPPTQKNTLFTNPVLTSVTMPISTPSSKFLQLCSINDGILFEDEIIQVGIKAKYSGLGEGVLGVYYGNKTSGILQNVQTRYFFESTNSSSNLHLTTSPIPTQLGPKSQVCQRVSAQLSGAFVQSPRLTVSFLLPDNTPRSIPLRLPITINKFMQGRDLKVDEFFSNWRIQLFLLNESSAVVNVSMNLAQIARASCLGGALSLHHQVDDVADNLVLVGQFPSDSADGIRCATIPEALVLVRIEVGTGINVGKARVAVRSNDSTVAEAVRESIVSQVSATNNMHA